MMLGRTFLTVLALGVGVTACSAQPSTSATADDAGRVDRDARAQIPRTFDRRLVGAWRCRGYESTGGWTGRQVYALTFGSNGTGTETDWEGGKRTAYTFVFGTFGASLYRYTHGSMPSDEAYSVHGQMLGLATGPYWHQGDGWIAVPEASKGICRRIDV